MGRCYGWSNRETWKLALELINHAPTYDYWAKVMGTIKDSDPIGKLTEKLIEEQKADHPEDYSETINYREIAEWMWERR